MKKTNFVIFGAMRTGSNHLIGLLNQHPQVLCHGELYNPGFVGVFPEMYKEVGYYRSQVAKRNQNIRKFSRILLTTGEKPAIGFKIFPGHSDYAFCRFISDPMRKIVLRRDYLSSYISFCSAQQSGVWQITTDNKKKLEENKKRSSMPVIFDAHEFSKYCRKHEVFYNRIDRILHDTDENVFRLNYENINDAETLRCLQAYLGVEVVDHLQPVLTKQTEKSLLERIKNVRSVKNYIEDHAPGAHVINEKTVEELF